MRINNPTNVPILAAGVSFFLFLLLAIVVVVQNSNNSELKNNVVKLSVSLQDSDKRAQAREDALNALTQKIEILDEAVNSNDKRSAVIKHVRKAILDIQKQEKMPNFLSPGDLTKLSAAVVDASDEFDVPKSLILGVIKQESAFNIKAISHAGANGLMQIMPETAEEISKDLNRPYYNIFSIRDNVRFGTWYLWKMNKRFKGDLNLVIRAYNAGPTLVEKVVAGEIKSEKDYDNDGKLDPPYPRETRLYLKAVLDGKQKFESLGL